MQKIAIIGASRNRTKFGNKAVQLYDREGWTVYPVHPSEKEIEGLKCFKEIKDVPEPLDRVSLYLPPKIALETLDQLVPKSPKEVYLNPGVDAPEVLEKGRELGLNIIAACSIVAIGVSPSEAKP